MSVIISSRLRRRWLSLSRLQSLAGNILLAAGARRAELSLLLVGDRSMRRMNRIYRRKNRTTDVLAFPMRHLRTHRTPHASPLTPSLLGDVVISLPQAERQAARAGHSPERELAALITHGVLHLLGYDHERSHREARRMVRREALVLRRSGAIPKMAANRK
jgi:rRNA maturation RNase YbeY